MKILLKALCNSSTLGSYQIIYVSVQDKSVMRIVSRRNSVSKFAISQYYM